MLKRLLSFISWITQTSPAHGLHPVSRTGAGHSGRTHGAANPTSASPSDAERAAYWQARQDIPREARMANWERQMDSWVVGLTGEQQAFLKRLLSQNGQPLDTVAVTAQALYTTFMVDGQGQLEYFVQRIAERNTPEDIRHNLPLIEHLAKIYGSESAQLILPLIMPALRQGSALTENQDHHTFSLCIGTDMQTGQEVVLTPKALEQHVAVTGVSGAGKTTWLLNMINQICRQSQGFALIEPHGDLTRQVIACIPEEILERVIYLDFADSRSHFGLNLFQCDVPDDMTKVAKVASFVMHVFEKVWHVGTDTPRLAQVLRNTTRTLIENPGMTFAEIPLLLWDDIAREKLISNVTNIQTQLFWQQYNRKSGREKDELTASFSNKVDAYLNEPLIANIVSQSQTTIDFRKIMDEGKILLVNLSPQLEEMSRLIGTTLIGRLLMAAFSRTDTPPEDRMQFHIFIDEFQRFSSSELRTFIEEARKFKVTVTIAHQSLSQLEEEHRTVATGAGTMMVFRVNGDDAKVFARSFDATPQPVVIGEEPQRAVAADPLSHLVSRGHQDSRVAKYAQIFLHNLEQFLKTPTSPSVAYVKEWYASYDNGVDGMLSLYEQHVQQGRKLLNQTLYACMSEANPTLYIPMLATYVLACSQRDGRERVFSPHVKHYNHGILFGPFSLQDFEPSARKFGEPVFTEPQRAERYIASVAKYAKKEQWMAEAVVAMLTELRYTMQVLAHSPIMIDTGQMVPKVQLRTYSDQENQIANEISQLENYHAKVKTLTGEHTIRTHPAPHLLSDFQVQARINQIKLRMLAQGYCRDYREVQEEIRKRHEQLRQRPHSDAPPPASTTGRPPRRLRQKPPPAFT